MLKKLKEKHWDETWYVPENEPGSPVFLSGGIETPPLRRAARAIRRLCTEHPLVLISTVATVVAAIAAVIPLLR